jgi:pimeloyl-ACP methyl ester carboxylesterase/class 3 adenylate cyclase
MGLEEVVPPPETRYARLQGDRIAYQVLGEGPPDLVLTPGSFGHLDIGWEDPGIALFCRTLASFCRLILFDRRGTGISDPLPPDPLPPWEAYAQELAAVLDEIGTERAALLAELDAGPTAIIFAATQPQRVRALVLSHATARFVAADDYPIGLPAEVAEAVAAQSDQLWGTEAMVAMMAPSRAGDERFRRWLGKMVRAGASPKAAQKLVRAMLEVDVRPVLPLIQAPTLVLHRRDAQLIPIGHGRYLADHIPGANLVELSGVDSTLFWEAPEVALDQIEAFLTGVHRTAQPTRILATVLFTDIVDATGRASRLGDRRWRELLDVHDELARRLVEEFGGQLIKTIGDGILATFDGAWPSDPLCGRPQGRAERHRRPDPGRVAHRRGGTPRRRRRRHRRPHRGPGDGGRPTRGHPDLQNRPRPRRRLRHHPAGPWRTPLEGRGGHLAAVHGTAALAVSVQPRAFLHPLVFTRQPRRRSSTVTGSPRPSGIDAAVAHHGVDVSLTQKAAVP